MRTLYCAPMLSSIADKKEDAISFIIFLGIESNLAATFANKSEVETVGTNTFLLLTLATVISLLRYELILIL